MNGKETGCRAGFTLVEVMVSLVIFLVASMGLLPLLMTNLQVNQGNGLHARARTLAGEAMAELQVIDYAVLSSVPETPEQYGPFQVSRQVDDNQPLPEQSRITVNTRWVHHDRVHSYQLQTIRSAP